jgi:hypothetical protein
MKIFIITIIPIFQKLFSITTATDLNKYNLILISILNWT